MLALSDPFAKLPKPKVLLVVTAANGAEFAARAANVDGAVPEALGASLSPSAIRMGAGLSPLLSARGGAAPPSWPFASAAEAVLAVAPGISAGKICRPHLSSKSLCFAQEADQILHGLLVCL